MGITIQQIMIKSLLNIPKKSVKKSLSVNEVHALLSLDGQISLETSVVTVWACSYFLPAIYSCLGRNHT